MSTQGGVTASPRLSCTIIPAKRVVSVDEQQADFQVLMIERSRELRVLPGFLAFPGGAVDQIDERVGRSWKGTNLNRKLAGWGWRPEDLLEGAPASGQPVDPRYCGALVLLAAGVRELLEEVGLNPDVRQYWNAEALAELRSGDVTGWQRATKRFNPTAPLRYFGRRVTPEAFRYRFDAHFIVAQFNWLEDLQCNSTEVARAFWVAPADALAWADDANGEVRLAPPTVDALRALAAYTKLDELMVQGRMPDQVNDPRRIDLLREQLSGGAKDSAGT